MRLYLKHEFACTPEELWQLLEDESVDMKMVQASGGNGSWISDVREGSTRITTKSINVQRELPGPMKKILGTDQIGYDMVIRRTDGSNQQSWIIRPRVLADRFTGSGTTVVTATPTGCVRIIEGDLTVKVPLLGGKMEARLIEDVTTSYDKGAEVLRAELIARR